MPLPDENIFDRRKISIRDGILILTNIVALVWGASTLSSSVNTLDKTVTSLNATVQEINKQLTTMRQDFGERLRVLEDRSRRNEDMFNGRK